MAKVTVRDDESLDQALRRFNREVVKEGILKEIKRREFYEKPSTIKKKEKQVRERRNEFREDV